MGTPRRRQIIQFTPELEKLFNLVTVPGTNVNSNVTVGENARKAGVQALNFLAQEAARKDAEIEARSDKKTVKRLTTIDKRLRGDNGYSSYMSAGTPMSGWDPALGTIFDWTVGAKGIDALGKTALWNYAKYVPTSELGRWGRNYFINNAFKLLLRQPILFGLGKNIAESAYVSSAPKPSDTGLTSLKFFERKPSKLTERERAGQIKLDRNIRQHGEASAPYYDYSLINKHYKPWTVDEKGNFIFESPEKSGTLGTIHFSFNEPVVSHIMGSWDDAPTVTILPYRNIRSKAAPVDMAIMDTYFPNYNGLKISSRGSKTLTGDKATFDYYKSRGLDVEFSPEMETKLQELKALKDKYEVIKSNPEYDYFKSKEGREVLDLIQTVKESIDRVGREWAKGNVKPIPSYEKVNALGTAEGFNMEKYPFSLASPKYNGYGIPLEESATELNYKWVTDPSNHFMIGEHPEEVLKSALRGDYGEVRPEFIKYLRWASEHGADFRDAQPLVGNAKKSTKALREPNVSVTANVETTAKQEAKALSLEEILKAFEAARQWHLNRINSPGYTKRALRAGFTEEEVPQLLQLLIALINRLKLLSPKDVLGPMRVRENHNYNGKMLSGYWRTNINGDLKQGIAFYNPYMSYDEAVSNFIHEFGHGATFSLNGTETSGYMKALADQFPLINRLVKYNRSLYPEINAGRVEYAVPGATRSGNAVYYASPTEMLSRGYEFMRDYANNWFKAYKSGELPSKLHQDLVGNRRNSNIFNIIATPKGAINFLKNALGISVPLGLGGYSLYSNNNLLQQLQYLKQGGKMNTLLFLKNGKLNIIDFLL